MCVFVIFVVLAVTDIINLIKNTSNDYTVLTAIIDLITQLAEHVAVQSLEIMIMFYLVCVLFLTRTRQSNAAFSPMAMTVIS